MSHSRLRSRHIASLVIGLAALPLIGLISAGYLLLAQNRQLEERGRRDRLQHAGNAVVAELERALLDAERALAAGQQWWPDGAIAVTFRSDRLTVTPSGRVAFLPVPEPLPVLAPPALQRGARLEYEDKRVAIAFYRQAAESRDSRERIAALLPLGSLLTQQGRTHEALAVFARLLDAPLFDINGTPSRLAARYARCVALERAARVSELREEAGHLVADMQALAPYLAGKVYKDYAGILRRWLDRPVEEAPAFRGEAIEALWDRWQSNAFRPGTSGREAMSIESRDLVVLWQAPSGDSSTVRALIVTPDFAASAWLKRAQRVARDNAAAIEGGLKRAGPSTATPVMATRDGGEGLSLSVQPSSLPWSVTLRDIGETSRSVSRLKNLVLGSLAILTALMAAAAYAIIRAVERDVAVARLQSEFVAAVSHEFRTPLTALKHFVEILRDQPALDAAHRRQCYDAQGRAVDRLARLVESLLDFGRLEAGTLRYRFTAQDCATLVRAVVDEFNHHAQHAGYRAEIDANISATANVDAEAVSRALWNLLDNAMKYSPHYKTIQVGVDASDGEARIAVRDRGLGVPPHERSEIFHRFRRGAEARTRGIPGTGIGLAMVNEIMQAHGGRVDVATGTGEGSTFTLVLPLTS